MVLAMPRPSRHPKTGIFWLRERVPSERARVGRKVEYFSLQTREPTQAKKRHAEEPSPSSKRDGRRFGATSSLTRIMRARGQFVVA